MSVNKAILVGNLGRDPEVRYLPSGQSVANFTIATTENFTDRSGTRQERTEWHRIVAWGKLAEVCAQYLKKGRQVYIEGRIQSREWQDKEGQKRTSFDIVANTMKMLSSRADAAVAAGAGGTGGGASRGDDLDQSAPPEENYAGGGGQAAGPEISDEDIPF